MHDVISNVPNIQINCLDKGFVRLLDVMPRLVPDNPGTADFAVAQAARVSYGDGTKSISEDRSLIRYLMRHKHTSPTEMIEWKFHLKMPIFCARQILRHRMSSTNEYSGRYSIMKDEFYFPEVENIRQQSKTNKQGGDEQVGEEWAQKFRNYLETVCENSYDIYEDYMKVGIAREQARMILSVNNYTEFYWKIDLHNLFHFLALRCDKHAQQETRVFADAMLELIKPIVPVSVEAWEDYHDHRGAMKLTRLEIEALRRFISWAQDTHAPALECDNKREQAEWAEKAKRLGLLGIME